MVASLYKSKITGKLMHKIDLDIKQNGLGKAMESIFSKTHTEIILNKECIEVDKALEKEPTLVICNHPSEAEVLVLLMELGKRKDLYMVVNHNFTNILPTLDSHIISVYISDRLVKDKSNWKFRIMKKIHKVDHFGKEECHSKNIKSIEKASKKISEGALVAIFPAAGVKSGKFLDGVGYIIKNLTNKSKAKLVMAHVRGTSTWDYLRFIPLVNRIMPAIKINFAKPIDIFKYSKEDAKMITSEVERDYFRWTEKNA